jgi:hypothetical protein
MVLRRFRKEVVLAGFAAETQAPMVVADKTKLSTAVCAAVFQLGHEALRFGGRRAMLSGGRAVRRRISSRQVDKQDALPRGFRQINILQSREIGENRCAPRYTDSDSEQFRSAPRTCRRFRGSELFDLAGGQRPRYALLELLSALSSEALRSAARRGQTAAGDARSGFRPWACASLRMS